MVNAVQFRQRFQRTLNCAAWGLLAAAFVVLTFPLLAGLFLIVSILIGLFRLHTLSQAARLIDRHYHFKDRTLTAIDLLQKTNPTPMQQLQIEDTAEHLKNVQPRAVFPIRLPKVSWIALVVFAFNLSGTAVVRSQFNQPVEIVETVIQTMPEEDAATLEEIVAKTEKLIQKHLNEQQLQQLSRRLQQLAEKLDLTNNDIKETLATLSELDEAFQSVIDSFQLEMMEASLLELAKTLELAEPTLPISGALEKKDYAQATKELKKLDVDTLEALSEPERKAMAEQMQILADSAEERNQKPLQEAAKKFSEALESGDGEQAKAATDALAGEVEKHDIRQNIGKDLANQQLMLALMKADGGGGDGYSMDGGVGTEKTETSSETWGFGSAGNPNEGEETDLEGQRKRDTLTGMLGEAGDSETEHVDAEITPENSRLRYREQFIQYRKLSEAVLDSEPIPLGQRQIIRRYFESIRPSTE